MQAEDEELDFGGDEEFIDFQQAPAPSTTIPVRERTPTPPPRQHDPTRDREGNLLPEGWISKVSSSGAIYFKEVATGKTFWDIPQQGEKLKDGGDTPSPAKSDSHGLPDRARVEGQRKPLYSETMSAAPGKEGNNRDDTQTNKQSSEDSGDKTSRIQDQARDESAHKIPTAPKALVTTNSGTRNAESAQRPPLDAPSGPKAFSSSRPPRKRHDADSGIVMGKLDDRWARSSASSVTTSAPTPSSTDNRWAPLGREPRRERPAPLSQKALDVSLNTYHADRPPSPKPKWDTSTVNLRPKSPEPPRNKGPPGRTQDNGWASRKQTDDGRTSTREDIRRPDEEVKRPRLDEPKRSFDTDRNEGKRPPGRDHPPVGRVDEPRRDKREESPRRFVRRDEDLRLNGGRRIGRPRSLSPPPLRMARPRSMSPPPRDRRSPPPLRPRPRSRSPPPGYRGRLPPPYIGPPSPRYRLRSPPPPPLRRRSPSPPRRMREWGANPDKPPRERRSLSPPARQRQSLIREGARFTVVPLAKPPNGHSHDPAPHQSRASKETEKQKDMNGSQSLEARLSPKISNGAVGPTPAEKENTPQGVKPRAPVIPETAPEKNPSLIKKEGSQKNLADRISLPAKPAFGGEARDNLRDRDRDRRRR